MKAKFSKVQSDSFALLRCSSASTANKSLPCICRREHRWPCLRQPEARVIIPLHALLTRTISQSEVASRSLNQEEKGEESVKFNKLLMATHLPHLHSASFVFFYSLLGVRLRIDVFLENYLRFPTVSHFIEGSGRCFIHKKKAKHRRRRWRGEGVGRQGGVRASRSGE
jgi:hypothetical protein